MERNRSDENIFVPRRPSGAAVMQGDVTDALTRAFFEEWARVGYAALSLERVAKNAGAGKAALYRRWPSKVAMASDLLSKVGLTLTELPDRGSLEADLLAFLHSLRRVLRHRIIRRVVLDLHAETGREPALKAAILPFQEARRNRAKTLIDRAVARGEVPATVDRETAADFMVSALYWRLAVIGGHSDGRHLETIARMAAAAISVA
ncbi:TetR-like C-terminal domain-containing protein [Burkholderia sp. WAC0059]|uniref:TetR-like C-terminal domain-containing protein n=1 Tax=Burkholderia sp. WAC0059 TaxID=2066022 RepID=UPI001C63C0C0|nr:TetR-like C-terminal domain-containing protein [Burkholderia sp. WAC0059]